MSAAERAEESEAVRQRAMELPELLSAQSVMAFLPMPDELDTRPILSDLLRAGKRVYVPRTFVTEKRMIPVRLRDLDRLRVGEYNIAEPDGDEPCRPEEIDFIFVPARAYDLHGNRLGRGAGFYDRFMASDGFRAVRCGIGFDCQLLDQVPHAPHDLPVHIVVTKSRIHRGGTTDDGY